MGWKQRPMAHLPPDLRTSYRLELVGPVGKTRPPLEAGDAMARLEWTRDELLADLPYEEPLIAGGVRCHGGFVAGRYVSPRTLNRAPAITAWQERLRADGQPLVHIPVEFVPPHYPNYEQAKLLLQEGVRDPITRSLTIISIVEGFGARIRDLPLPDLRAEVVEDVAGTSVSASAIFRIT